MASSNRSRDKLHVSKLEAYKQFCVSQGWVEQPTKGIFEVLRMRHPEVKDPLIVHTKLSENLEHFTIWGQSARLFRDFMRSVRGAAVKHQDCETTLIDGLW